MAARLREIIAILFWLALLVKLFIFDVDEYAVEHLAPSLRWLLPYRFLFWLSLLAIAAVLVRSLRSASSVAYVVFYPAVLLFYRVPSGLLRNWPLLIAFSPAIYLALKGFRFSLIACTIGLISAVAACVSINPQVVIPALIALLTVLALHLARRIQEAFKESLFARLAKHIRGATGSMVGNLIKDGDEESVPSPPDDAKWSPIKAASLLHWGAEIISAKVGEVARGHAYNIYLVVSWFYTFALITVVYAIEYWSLARLTPSEFLNGTSLSFFRFLHFSLGILSTSGGSTIQAVGDLSTALATTEMFLIPVMGSIIIFSFFTILRDGYQRDADEFRCAINGLAGAIEERATVVYRLTVAQFEVIRREERDELIDTWRRARSVPRTSLTTPSVEDRTVNTTPLPSSKPQTDVAAETSNSG